MTPLTRDTVGPYLRTRGVLDGRPCTVDPLTGGVSNDVFEIRQGDAAFVLKQSLPVLRVSVRWDAPVERLLTEARALETAAVIEPGSVPQVVDVDPEAMTLTMVRADPSLENLRDQLLGGRIELDTAGELGRVLGRWHSATLDDRRIAEEFPPVHLEALRITPYYRHTAANHPDLESAILAAADGLLTDGCALVHGDFTPKNVLSDGARLQVLDWEVAHVGSPVFDLAGTLALLLLKAVRSPRDAAALQRFSDAFRQGHRAVVGEGERWSFPDLGLQVGCIVLARVDGRSPVDYLDARQQIVARDLGRYLIGDGSSSLQDGWEMVHELRRDR